MPRAFRNVTQIVNNLFPCLPVEMGRIYGNITARCRGAPKAAVNGVTDCMSGNAVTWG